MYLKSQTEMNVRGRTARYERLQNQLRALDAFMGTPRIRDVGLIEEDRQMENGMELQKMRREEHANGEDGDDTKDGSHS